MGQGAVAHLCHSGSDLRGRAGHVCGVRAAVARSLLGGEFVHVGAIRICLCRLWLGADACVWEPVHRLFEDRVVAVEDPMRLGQHLWPKTVLRQVDWQT